MIEIEGLSKKYGKVEALKSVDLRFESGQCVVLLGPNASGKTTLIKSILGLVKPTSGEIKVEGLSVQKDRSFLRSIGYMPQIGRYPDHMKVGQLIELILSLRKQNFEGPLDKELMGSFEIATILRKPLYTLSGGTRQKLGAVLAFLFNPPILILDEPTASLDPLAREILLDKLFRSQEEGKLMLISSHILSEVETLASHVCYLEEGNCQFFFSREEILERTSSPYLSKAITELIKSRQAYDLHHQIPPV